MELEIMEYLDFKLKQFIRITGLDTKKDGAKEILAAALRANKRQWTLEAIESVTGR